jgi:hypothetical protein
MTTLTRNSCLEINKYISQLQIRLTREVKCSEVVRPTFSASNFCNIFSNPSLREIISAAIVKNYLVMYDFKRKMLSWDKENYAFSE